MKLFRGRGWNGRVLDAVEQGVQVFYRTLGERDGYAQLLLNMLQGNLLFESDGVRSEVRVVPEKLELYLKSAATNRVLKGVLEESFYKAIVESEQDEYLLLRRAATNAWMAWLAEELFGRDPRWETAVPEATSPIENLAVKSIDELVWAASIVQSKVPISNEASSKPAPKTGLSRSILRRTTSAD